MTLLVSWVTQPLRIQPPIISSSPLCAFALIIPPVFPFSFFTPAARRVDSIRKKSLTSIAL